MALLADVVRELAEAQEVVRPVEGDPVLEAEAAPGQDLFPDRLEGVVSQGSEGECCGHLRQQA